MCWRLLLSLSSLGRSILTTKILLGFLEKAAEDLFVFTDQLQGVGNLSEADRRITSIDFELLVQPGSVEPFMRFTDPRKIIRDFISRIS